MAKAKKQENVNSETSEKESVGSILDKIKSIVSGKEKIILEEQKPAAGSENPEEEELLELVEIVDEDNEQHSPNAEQGAEIEQQLTENSEAMSQPEEEEQSFVDILQEIDQALGSQYNEQQKPAAPEVAVVETIQVEVAPEVIPEPVQEVAAEPVAEPIPVSTPPQAEVKNEPATPPPSIKAFEEPVSQNIMDNGNSAVKNSPMTDETKIISKDIAARSSKAIQDMLTQIPHPQIDSPAFRNATTLEDVMVEMLKPMLKGWLDKNLEVIVRDIVEREIRKIIPRE